MMLGSPPEVEPDEEKAEEANEDWTALLPAQYSSHLRDIVGPMLNAKPIERPYTHDLCVDIGRSMQIWREETAEGRQYVRWDFSASRCLKEGSWVRR